MGSKAKDVPLPLRQFLHYINTDEITDDYTDESEQEVTERVTADVTAQERRKTVFRMLENNFEPQMICIAADISEKELEEYRKEYAASRKE